MAGSVNPKTGRRGSSSATPPARSTRSTARASTSLRDRPDGGRLALRGARRRGRAALQRYPKMLDDEYGQYFKVARLFAQLIGRPGAHARADPGRDARRTLMEWVLRIMANLLRPDESAPPRPRTGRPPPSCASLRQPDQSLRIRRRRSERACSLAASRRGRTQRPRRRRSRHRARRRAADPREPADGAGNVVSTLGCVHPERRREVHAVGASRADRPRVVLARHPDPHSVCFQDPDEMRTGRRCLDLLCTAAGEVGHEQTSSTSAGGWVSSFIPGPSGFPRRCSRARWTGTPPHGGRLPALPGSKWIAGQPDRAPSSNRVLKGTCGFADPDPLPLSMPPPRSGSHVLPRVSDVERSRTGRRSVVDVRREAAERYRVVRADRVDDTLGAGDEARPARRRRVVEHGGRSRGVEVAEEVGTATHQPARAGADEQLRCRSGSPGRRGGCRRRSRPAPARSQPGRHRALPRRRGDGAADAGRQPADDPVDGDHPRVVRVPVARPMPADVRRRRRGCRRRRRCRRRWRRARRRGR